VWKPRAPAADALVEQQQPSSTAAAPATKPASMASEVLAADRELDVERAADTVEVYEQSNLSQMRRWTLSYVIGKVRKCDCREVLDA